jgi:hypothetical protein
MEKLQKCAILIVSLIFFAIPTLAQDKCATCGKLIPGTIYLITDEITGEQLEICGDCNKLPRCFRCGMPVNDDGLALPDGRYLCARDRKTVVLTTAEAEKVASDVEDCLQRLFVRFTTFPTNVDVTAIDKIDINRMFESSDLLGCIQAETNDNVKRYSMCLMTGFPLAQVQSTAAHEFSHAWVGENVSSKRRKSLSRDTEEGFCEMVAYLLIDSLKKDSQNEEAEKKRILKNLYTRGQVQLFIEGEKTYGFDQILDWMQYGDTSELEPGRLDKIKDVVMPRPAPIADSGPSVNNNPAARPISRPIVAPKSPPAPETLRIEGLFWGSAPSAIINGHTVFSGDQFKVTIAGKAMHLHCLEIRKNSVLIENIDTGKKEELDFKAEDALHKKV